MKQLVILILTAWAAFAQGRISLRDIRQSGATTNQCAKWNGTIWAPANCTSLSSPLTTKGDIWVFSTVDTRLGVGLDGKCLQADSVQATGLTWGTCGGVTSLNGLTGASQTFATGTSGTDFAISSASTTHTFDLPVASGTNTGKLSNTDWTTFNAKESALTFNSPLSRSVNTISCSTCEVTGNKNSASGYAGLTAGTKLTAAQGQEVWALADLTDVTAVRGNSTTVQLATGSAPSTNDCAKFDANGNLVTNGAACATQGAPTDATYIVESANGSLSAEVTLGTEISTNTVASRPAAAVAGRVFLPSDGIYVYRDTGAAWAPWGPLFALTEPVSGDYAWINQGGATLSTTNGGVNITAPSNAGDSLRIRKKAKTGTYTIIIGFNSAFLGDNFFAAGFVWRQSSDGKLVTVGFNQTNQIQVSKWTNATTFSADYLLKTLRQPGPIIWFKAVVDSTNRVTSISPDGINWVQVHSVGKTDFMTADEVGFFVNANNASFGATATFWHWSEGS